MARYFRGTGDTLRFIEFMDVGATNGWRMDDVVPAAEIVATVDAEFPLEPADANYRGEVAKRWRYLDGKGEIGVIASVTQPFCGDCTRVADLGRGQALHLPVRGARPRPAGAHPQRGDRRGARRQARRDLARPRRPLLGAPLRGDRPTTRRASR